LSYVPTVEILADRFTKPLPKSAILKQVAAVGMIGNGLGIGIVNGHGNGLGTIGNGFWNCHGIDIGTGNAIGNAIGMYIDWALVFRGDPQCLIGSASLLFTFFV
jgi:hypothetical protein